MVEKTKEKNKPEKEIGKVKTGATVEMRWSLVQITNSLCSLVAGKASQSLTVRWDHIISLGQWLSGKSDMVTSFRN